MTDPPIEGAPHDDQADADADDAPSPVGPVSRPTLAYARDDTALPPADLITVATFADSWEAHLAIGKLEAAGIPAMLADENIVSAGGGLYAGMTGGVKLQVPRVDARRALAALPPRVRAKITACPKCGSTETRRVDFSAGLKILFLLMLGIPYAFVERPWYCLACGHAWRPSDVGEVKDVEEVDDDDDDDDDDNDDAEPDDDGPDEPPARAAADDGSDRRA